MAIEKPTQTPLERVAKIAKAIERVEVYRIGILTGTQSLPYTMLEGASSLERENVLRRIVALPQHIDHALESLNTLQTHNENQVTDITDLYSTIQGIEDGYQSGWIKQDIYNAMQQVLEERMQQLFATSQPEKDHKEPEERQDKAPEVVCEKVDQKKAAELYHERVQSYSQQEGLTLTDGTHFSGNRAWIIHEFFQRGFTQNITTEVVAISIWGSLTTTTRTRASVLLASVVPIFERLGYRVASEAVRNPRGGKQVKEYHLEVPTTEIQKKK